MVDRVSTQVLANGAIRYAIYNSDGSFNRHEYILKDDAPSSEGTLIGKESLFNDAAATAWGLTGVQATPTTAFNRMVSQTEAEAGSVTQARMWSPFRVQQAAQAQLFSKHWIYTAFAPGTNAVSLFGRIKANGKQIAIGDKVDVFMVGGGGAGGGSGTLGGHIGMGGGGGGYTVLIRDFVLTTFNFDVVVGAGGVPNNNNGRGGSTTFYGYEAAGGYAGDTVGGDGGSGGGGGTGGYESQGVTSGGSGGMGSTGGHSFGGTSGVFVRGGTRGPALFNHVSESKYVQALNPYDGIFYGCGGGGGSSNGPGGYGGGDGGYPTLGGSSLVMQGKLGGGGAGGSANSSNNLGYGGSGGSGGGGGGGGSSFSGTSTPLGGNGGNGLLYIYA